MEFVLAAPTSLAPQAGRGEQIDSRPRAALFVRAPRLDRVVHERAPPKREAERRKARGRFRGPAKQALPPVLSVRRGARPFRSALASRRSTAALARGLAALAQSGPALHGRGQPIRSPGSQLLADRRLAGRASFRTARAQFAKPRPGTALTPPSGSHPECALGRAR
jgi:hypothetical protein